MYFKVVIEDQVKDTNLLKKSAFSTCTLIVGSIPLNSYLDTSRSIEITLCLVDS